MGEALLILTLTPVQSFIAEARRTSDLYVGSQILVQLVKAAAEQIGPQRLVYPAPLNGSLPDDLPNVLVARVDGARAEQTALEACQALQAKWKELADAARKALETYAPSDRKWNDIWDRQVESLWQVFWVTVPMDSLEYRQAYLTGTAALAAVKRSRVFPQVEEPGPKDSLSGRREVLHRQGESEKDYWSTVAANVGPSRLRPDGRERLDAIGAIKRFCPLANRSFPSTSTVASADFLERVRQKAREQLGSYRQIIEWVLGSFLYSVRPHDQQWPYDGDLLLLETLTEHALRDSYGGLERPQDLERARQALRELYRAAGERPSLYYAVLVLDGDSMGAHIRELLQRADPEAEHRQFSRQLTQFANEVPQVMDEVFRRATWPGHSASDGSGIRGRDFLVYNGGDDVLTFAPLAVALPMAKALAEKFSKTVQGCSASGGVALVHHRYPLSGALAAAREAESIAKAVKGKGAVAVTLMRRSGERITVRSRWGDLGDHFETLVSYFAQRHLSSKYAYDLAGLAPALTALPADGRRASLKQLVYRHRARTLADPDSLVDRLAAWAEALDEQTPPEYGDNGPTPQGLTELARWTVLARFVAQGGAG